MRCLGGWPPIYFVIANSALLSRSTLVCVKAIFLIYVITTYYLRMMGI